MTVSAKREARVELKSKFDDEGVREARRKLKQEEREQARAAKQAARDAKRARKEMLSMSRGVLGGVAQGFEVALGIGAAGGIAGMASQVFDYEKALARLQITASTTPEAMREYSGTVEQASRATGINRNEILSAASAYVALTGDMDTARAATGTWAKIAQATGSTVSDIAQTAAALSQQMGIGPAQMESTFSALAQQGKAGAIELKDLAGVMSQIAPMWAQFKGGKGVEGVRELGAALQIVKRGFGGDASETVTGLQSLLVSLQKNAGRFKANGIKVFDVDKNGKETMRGVFEIVDDISKSSLVKHPDLLEKAFSRVEAYRSYLQLVQGSDARSKFVEDSRDVGLIQRDFDTYMQSSAARMEQSWNAVKLALADAFTPERIEKFATALDGMAAHVGDVTAAAGKLADAWMYLFNIGRRIRGAFTDVDDENPFKTKSDDAAKRFKAYNDKFAEVRAPFGQSEAFGAGPRFGVGAPAPKPTKEEEEQHQRDIDAMGKAASWHRVAKQLMDLMPGNVVTEQAIKAAYAATKETLGNDVPDVGARTAGQAFLDQVPRTLVDKVVGQLHAKEQKDYGAQIVRQYVQPVAQEIAAAIRDAITHVPTAHDQAVARYREINGQWWEHPPINVKVGSEPVVRASQSAPVLRTRNGSL